MELPAAGARARVSARRAAKPAVRGQRAAPARPCSRIEPCSPTLDAVLPLRVRMGRRPRPIAL